MHKVYIYVCSQHVVQPLLMHIVPQPIWHELAFAIRVGCQTVATGERLTITAAVQALGSLV